MESSPYKISDWNGVPVDEATVDEWIRECIDWLQRNPREDDTSIMSGDTKVIVRRCSFNLSDRYFEIMVCKVDKHGYAHRDSDPNPTRPIRSEEFE